MEELVAQVKPGINGQVWIELPREPKQLSAPLVQQDLRKELMAIAGKLAESGADVVLSEELWKDIRQRLLGLDLAIGSARSRRRWLQVVH